MRRIAALRRVCLAACAGLALALAGCAAAPGCSGSYDSGVDISGNGDPDNTLKMCENYYLDGKTKEVPASQYRKPAALHPVQVVFEAQAKKVANADLTAAMQAQVLQKIKDSGLFSTVGEAPVPGGALLKVTLDSEQTIGAGDIIGAIWTGLTLGIGGSSMGTLDFTCTMSYLADGQSSPITATAHHAIYDVVGLLPALPQSAVRMNSADDATNQMLSQILSTALDELSQDPAFASR